MRAITLASLLFAGIACQSTASLPYSELQSQAAAGETVSAQALFDAFATDPEATDNLRRLMELEAQALTIIEDEPLKLGSIGSAILEIYYGSLTGHFAMTRFYDHVGSPEAAVPHQAWMDAIRARMDDADGSIDHPFPVITPFEARTLSMIDGLSTIGSIYQSSAELVFGLMLVGKPGSSAENQQLQTTYFDLTVLYEAVAEQVAGENGDVDDAAPFTLMGYMAKEGDASAQTAVGAFLAARNRLDDAVGWLRAASRTGNILANTLLARIFWEQSTLTDNEDERAELLDLALENYMHAIALGSSDAMYSLAVLYLGAQFGEENAESAIPLLTQAADLGHTDSMLYLAHLHASGELVDEDMDQAAAFFVSASELGNGRARIAYARFLLANEAARPGDARISEWLQELTESEDAEVASQAMVLLGNMHARGVTVDASVGTAVRWFKNAVKTSPEDADIVNEVAWTLAVSDVDGLQRVGYARKIMDALMEGDDEAMQRPEYLDTWAATYAATGDFSRAVTLQEQALQHAREQNRDDVIGILEQHLQSFEARQVIIEPAP